MSSDLEQRLREALHDDAARARLVNPDRPADPDERSLPGAQHPARSPRRLVAAAAAIVLIAAAGAVVWFNNARDRDVGVTTAPDPDSTTVTTESATTTPEAGGPLDLDAVEEVESSGSTTSWSRSSARGPGARPGLILTGEKSSSGAR